MKKDKKNIIIAVLAGLLCLQTCSKCSHDRVSKFNERTMTMEIVKSDSLYKTLIAERDGLLIENKSLQADIQRLTEKDSISQEIIKSLKSDKSNLNNVNKLLLKKEQQNDRN